MNNSAYPNNHQEAISVPVQKCPYHVTFDLDLDLEHIVDADLPGDHRVQVWWRSGHLPARSDGQCKFSVHCGQTDCNTSLPRAGEVMTFVTERYYMRQENIVIMYDLSHARSVSMGATIMRYLMLSEAFSRHGQNMYSG